MVNTKFRLICLICILLAACTPSASPEPPTAAATVPPSLTPTLPATVTPTPEPTSTLTLIPTHTPIPPPTSTPRPTAVLTSLAPQNPVVDVLDIILRIDGETLQVLFFLKDIPQTTPFNRVGNINGSTEYKWGVYLETDNNPDTGTCAGIDDAVCKMTKGMDYNLTAMYWYSGEKPVSQPLEQAKLQISVFQGKNNQNQLVSMGKMKVDRAAKTLELSGKIPGLKQAVQAFFVVVDANPPSKALVDYGSIPLDRWVINP